MSQVSKADLLRANTWQEVAPALLRAFDGSNSKNAKLKRDTVFAIVDARLAGESIETVFRRPNTCSRTTYYKKDGWADDEEFKAAVEHIYDLAIRHKDLASTRQVLGVKEAFKQVAAQAFRKQLDLMTNSDDERVQQKASQYFLDTVDFKAILAEELQQDLSADDDQDSIEEWLRQREEAMAHIELASNMFEGVDVEIPEEREADEDSESEPDGGGGALVGPAQELAALMGSVG